MKGLLKKIAQRAVRVCYPHGAVRPILRGPCKGMRFVCAHGMSATYAWQYKGGFHHHVYAQHVRPGMCVVDVGANTGQGVLAFSRLVGERGQVVACEPIEDVLGILKQQIALNKLSNVHVVPAAMGSEGGSATFEFSGALPTQGKMQGVEAGYKTNAPFAGVNSSARMQTVPVRRLDDVFAGQGTLPQPSFIKIDVEGAAGEVIAGAQQVLAGGAILFIELHGPEEQAAVAGLARLGYVFENEWGQPVENPAQGWHSPLICKKV